MILLMGITEHGVHINFFLAAVYGLVGFVLRLAWYYWEYSNVIDAKTPGAKFPWKRWWRIYDKYIILNLVACLALSLVSDWIWHFVEGWFFDAGTAPAFDERINIIIGFLAIAILYFINNKAIKRERERL